MTNQRKTILQHASAIACGRVSSRTLLAVAGVVVFSSARVLFGQTAALELPEPKEEVAHQDVAWSPDGRWIAYSEYAGGKDYDPKRWSIYVVAADGSERRRLVENALYVTWSRDGKKLAFGSSRDGNREIYTINADGSDIRRLTHDDAKDNLPAWSPTTDKIAFCSTRSGNEDIYVMSSDGSNVQRLTDDPASDFNPAWSPDGKYLVFFRETGDHKDQIYVVNADGSGERRITHDERSTYSRASCPTAGSRSRAERRTAPPSSSGSTSPGRTGLKCPRSPWVSPAGRPMGSGSRSSPATGPERPST